MASALRRLGVFLFCLGAVAVVVGLVPVGLSVVEAKKDQLWLAVAMVGGLLVVSGLVMDWLGAQSIRESQAVSQPVMEMNQPNPPSLKLSSSPKGPKGYREDLMA